MTIHYVDAAVATSGNGTSWAAAWKTFANINWSTVLPGDTVSISGGTYATELTVGASGTASSRITIAAATDPGHNAQVIIDRAGGADGVGLDGRSYVTVHGLNVRNISDAGMWIRNATGDILENNSVYSGDPGGGNARGYDVRGSTNTILRSNGYTTPASTLAQTDGIWSSGNDGNLYEWNNLVISNSNTNGHSDGIQSFQDKNITILGNYIAHPNGGLNNHGLWLTDTVTGGTISIIDNIIDMPVGDETGIGHWNQTAGYSGRVVVENNTVYGAEWGVYLNNSPLSVVENNIFTPHGSQATGVVLAGASPGGSNIDYNLIFGGSAGSINGSLKTWAQWQAAGYDAHGVNADPKFVNPAGHDFHLQASSPATDHGVTLSNVTTDYAGTPRPQGSAYDIGAYEAAGAVVPPDTLTLILSEDPYQGRNAQFIASIDGTQIIGPTTVTALHAMGQEQMFSVQGMWAGTHDLAISFVNDNRTMDLWVDQVKLNSTSYLNEPDVMLRNGTLHFAIGH